MAQEAGDGVAALDLAICESGVLLTMARFRDAAEVGLRGLRAAGQSGLQAFFGASMVAANAAQALLARGRTADAAAVIDPLTAGPPHLDHWLAHECRAEIDLLRGDIDAADRRQQQIEACVGHHGSIDDAREAAQWAAEVALWAGRPGDSLAEARRVLALLEATDLTIFCGRLLAMATRACADLAETARARKDEPAAEAALADAADLGSQLDRMAGTPFTDHPFVATIPADHASAASGYICPVDLAESFVVGVVVAPDDVPADHAGLFLVARVVGGVEREVTQGRELGFDPV